MGKAVMSFVKKEVIQGEGLLQVYDDQEADVEWAFHRKANIIVMLWVIGYHLYNLINVKNTYGGVLLLVKFRFRPCEFFTFLKLNLFWEEWLMLGPNVIDF